MGKPKKQAKVGHQSATQTVPTRQRVLVYRDGKLRLRWQELDG